MAQINLRLSLRWQQAEVFLCGKRFIVLVTGRRWGKTTLALWYLIVNACSSEGRICYYIAPTYSQAKRIAWNRLQQLVPKEACRRVNEQELLVELLNGSIIQLHGANRPDRLRGVGLDCVVMDEFADMKVETWNSVIRPALSNRRGGAMFIGTPRGRNHLYDLYSRAKFREDWAPFRFSTEQGGYVPRDELEAVACEMDPTEYAREFCASFEDSRVRVYHGFNLDENVVELTQSPHAQLLVGMDFNVSPMTAVVGQRFGDQCHIIDEIVLMNSNTQEMMDELNRRYAGCEGIVHRTQALHQEKPVPRPAKRIALSSRRQDGPFFVPPRTKSLTASIL